MTVTAVRKDPQALTMTIDAEFDVSPERVWQLWADPILLLIVAAGLVCFGVYCLFDARYRRA
jgi:hypothetical protein